LRGGGAQMGATNMILRNRLFRNGRVVFLVAIAMRAGGVHADTAVAEGTGDTLEEIVVTANKRSQNLQDVAMTASVLGASEISEQKITTLEDVAAAVPGLTFSPSETNTPVFTLRGVGFDAGALAAYPTVSVYLDEIPLPFPVLSTQGAFDLQRIEVLKGPQGTLYGENSTGGAVNYIAAKPTDALSAGGDVSYSRFNTVEVNGFASGPLTDTLKARVSLHYEHGDDWQYDYTRDDTLGKTDVAAARLILEWAPADALRLSVDVNAWLDRSDPQAGQLDAIYPQAAAYATPELIDYPYPPQNSRAADWMPGSVINPLGQVVNDRPFSDRHADQAFLRADYLLSPSITLTSLSSYIRFDQSQANGYDGTALVDDSFLYNSGSIGSFYQELRAANGDQSGFRWIGGANFQSSHVGENDAIGYWQSTNYNPALDYIFQTGFGSDTFRRDYAFYGNGEYDVSDKLTLQAGARYTDNLTRTSLCTFDLGDGRLNRLLTELGTLLSGTTVPPLTQGSCVTLNFQDIPGPPYRDTLEQSNVSWRVGPQYKLDQDTMLYANAARGYKAGSFPTLVASSWKQYVPVTQESVTSFEAGIKSSFLDQHLTLNSAAFYYDYLDKQIEGKVLDPVFGVLNRLINVPKSKLYGGEIEASLRSVLGTDVRAAVTYVGSRVTEYMGTNAIGQTRNFAGDRIPFAPMWQGRLDAEHKWEFGAVQPFVGADVSARSWTTTYIGGESITIPSSPLDSTAPGDAYPFVIKGYATVDMRAGVAWDKAKWRATLWGKNVFNNYYFTNSIYSFDTGYRLTGRPATFGISLFYKY
jgi:iron complex outermembrane recepter protein